MYGCYLRLKETMPQLSNSERKAAAYILEFPNETVLMPIDALANNCGTSKSAVVRLCKSLGFKGYKEFCIRLNADLISSPPENTSYQDIHPGDDLQMIAKAVTENNRKSLENVLGTLDYNELERAVDAMTAARRIDFYGCGNSGLVAQDAQNKFMRINKISISQVDPHMQIVSAATLVKGDVAVLISYSGETNDILSTHELIRRTGATTVSITRYGKNSLSELTDIRLYTASLETLIRSAAMSSRIGQLNIIDILFSAVASREFPEIKHYLDLTSDAYRKKKKIPMADW